MKMQILSQKTRWIVTTVILVLCLYSNNCQAKAHKNFISTKTAIDFKFSTKTDSMQLVTKNINNNKFATTNQSPLEVLQEKSSLLKRRLRETEYWSKSIMWNESANWMKKVFT